MAFENQNQSQLYQFTVIPQCEIRYFDDSNWGYYTFSTKDDIPYCETYKDLFNDSYSEGKIGKLIGRMQKLFIGSEYEVTARITFNKKYNNYSYEPTIVTAVVPKTLENQKLFLEAIITPRQAEILLDAYPNIVNDVLNGQDHIDLNRTKGIKDYTWGIIKEKILENYIISDILTMLQPLGVTFPMIRKLISNEPNPELLKQKLLDNPYMLTSIEGLGFKRVDALALKLVPELRVSFKRTYAYIKYFLYETGESDGHTWVNIEVLHSGVRDNIIECEELYEQVLEIEKKTEALLYFNEDKVGLKYFRNVEENIFEILNDLNKYNREWDIDIENGIKEAEEEQGFAYTPEQRNIITKAINDNIVLITGKAGTGKAQLLESEVFTEKGFKRIKDLAIGEKIYGEDGEIHKIIGIYPQGTKKTYRINFSDGTNTICCDEHLWNYRTVRQRKTNKNWTTDSLNNIIKLPLYKQYGNHNRMHNLYIPLTKPINFNKKEYFIPPYLLGLLLGDGCITQRTINIHNIDDEIIQYIKEWCNNNDFELIYVRKGFYRFKSKSKNNKIISELKRLDLHGCKSFNKFIPEEYLMGDISDRIELLQGLIDTDGFIGSGKVNYYTTSVQLLNNIKFIVQSLGGLVNIQKPKINYKNKFKVNHQIYVLNIKLNNIVLSKISRKIGKYNKPKNTIRRYIDSVEYFGEKECACIMTDNPTGLYLTNDFIVTHNTTVTRALLKIYKNYHIACAALSAKAAQRIQEATGFPASTMHRLLGAKGLNEYTYNQECPLPHDVILIDECSMVNAKLYYDILCAIRPGTKVIMCGDARQLPPIGFGNIFSDLLKREDCFNINRLTKVLRQAEMSGILSDANQIRDGINPVVQPELKLIHGELQDMYYMFRDNRDALNEIAIKMYLKSVETDGLDEVIIITPRKRDCINSTKEINTKIQNILINNDVPSIQRGERIFKLGAKVIQRVNNYDKNIFNGEIGYITDIWKERDTDMFNVQYPNKLITYNKNELDQMDLAYALTCHLTQGSGYKIVIGIVDNTHYALLDSCLLYTLITRAKKKCLLLAEPSAFKKCIENNKSIIRQTWLKDL